VYYINLLNIYLNINEYSFVLIYIALHVIISLYSVVILETYFLFAQDLCALATKFSSLNLAGNFECKGTDGYTKNSRHMASRACKVAED